MKKQRFREEQNPKEYSKYARILELERDKLGFSEDYKKNNKALISEWLSEKDDTKKLEIRNKLVLGNLKLAHELFYTKLKVNLFKHDSVDILQEINLTMIEAVNYVLEKTSKKDIKYFSVRLFYRLMSGLERIFKTYYEYTRYHEELIGEDEIQGEEQPENRKDEIQVLLNSRCLLSREQEILKRCYLDNEPGKYEDIGYYFGLTGARVGQIKEKSIKKIREYLEEIEEKRKRKSEFNKEIQGYLNSRPFIKYVYLFPRIPWSKEKESLYCSKIHSRLGDLVLSGVDLSEWLIVGHGSYEYYLNYLNYPGLNYLWKPIEQNPYPSEDHILDRCFLEYMPGEDDMKELRRHYKNMLRKEDMTRDDIFKILGYTGSTIGWLQEIISLEGSKRKKDQEKLKSLMDKMKLRAIIKKYYSAR